MRATWVRATAKDLPKLEAVGRAERGEMGVRADGHIGPVEVSRKAWDQTEGGHDSHPQWVDVSLHGVDPGRLVARRAGRVCWVSGIRTVDGVRADVTVFTTVAELRALRDQLIGLDLGEEGDDVPA